MALLIARSALAATGCTYEPGTQEQRWCASGPVHGRVCSLLTDSDDVADSRSWLDFAGARPRTPTADAARVLSRFHCDHGGVSRPEYIEPLTGIARHPFAKVNCQRTRKQAATARELESVHLANASYVIPSDRCGGRAHGGHGGGRALLFDMGCGTNAKAPGEMALGRQASVMPGSLMQFVSMYARRCIEFDRIFAWEATPFSAASWWRALPVAVRAKASFFNLPVPSEPTDGDDSFLRILNATAAPHDFVAVKLDIDAPAVEISIVRALLRNPALTALVDELFFEYHFYEPHWRFGWTFADAKGAPTVDDALGLMQQLRRRGVRAHFWV